MLPSGRVNWTVACSIPEKPVSRELLYTFPCRRKLWRRVELVVGHGETALEWARGQGTAKSISDE